MIELRRGCDDGLTDSQTVTIPAKTIVQFGGIGPGNERCVGNGVILPTAFGGIVTGTVLAVARAAGETAPLLFTTSIFSSTVSTDVTHSMANIPVLIFIYSEQPDAALHQDAWAAAVVLIGFVLLASLAARGLLARSRRKLGR